ncbi:uncharacterized protein LOC136039763 isoform X2 [Artemia franciscana]|uniref:C2H2-type domain-containing protein n=1 Tax=Artemia franciscana TaxID=6661 RepID=A0AA88HUA3_ARTSF|nr:hypothetical protein QYM36_008723 [Artemia franciscana]
MKKDSDEGRRLKLESLKQRRGRPCNKFPPNVPLEERPSRYIVRSVYIGVGNARRWGNVKQRLGFTGDVDFVAFLLRIAESLPSSKEDKPIDITTAMAALAATAQRFLEGYPLQNGIDIKDEYYDEEDEELTNESEQPCENLSQDIPVLNADSDLKLKQKRVCDEKSEMSENDPFAFQEFPDPPIPLNIRAASSVNECLNLTVEDKNRPCYSCNTSHPDTDCPLFIPTDCILDYRGEPDLADEESESRGKSKLEGKQDSDEDSNNLKIDERKEEKETASSAGEEKFPDQTENTKYPKANLLLEGALLAAETPLSMASLPRAFRLEQRDPNHGLSVVARQTIQSFTQFGPLLGIPVRETDILEDFPMRYIWEVYGESGKHYVSILDPQRSNWFRYLRPAPTREERNLAAVVRGDLLYLLSIVELKDGDELLYWVDDPSPVWAKKKVDKLSCGGCSCSFDHPLYYRTHVNVFHDPNFSLTVRKFFCKVCSSPLLGKEALVKHAAEEHEGKGAYQCSFCGKFFLRPNYLEMHRNYGCAANPNRERPQCHLCGKKFCQPQKLKIHIKKIHGEVDPMDEQKQYPCKFCDQVMATRAALHRHHRETHNKETGGACACDTCGKLFQNKSNLKIHMLTHSGVKPFRCPIEGCEMGFSTKQVTQVHLKKAHGYNEDNMPHVERTIPYTFDAYSAGNIKDTSRGKSSLDPPDFEDSLRDLDTDNQSDYQPLLPEQLKPIPLTPNTIVTDDGCIKKKRGRPLGWRKPKQDPLGQPSEPVEEKKKKKKSENSTKKQQKNKNIFDAADLKAFYAAAADLQNSFAQGKFSLNFEQNHDIKENGEPLFTNKEIFPNFPQEEGSYSKDDDQQFMPADLSYQVNQNSGSFISQAPDSSTSTDMAEQVLDLANHQRSDDDKPSLRTYQQELQQAQDLTHSPQRNFNSFEGTAGQHEEYQEQFQAEDFRNAAWRKEEESDRGIDMSVSRGMQQEIVAQEISHSLVSQDITHNLVSQEVTRMTQNVTVSRHDIARLTESMEDQNVTHNEISNQTAVPQNISVSQESSSPHEEYNQAENRRYMQEPRPNGNFAYDFDPRQYEQPQQQQSPRQHSPQTSQWRSPSEVHIPQMSPMSPSQTRPLEQRVQNESPLSFVKPTVVATKRQDVSQDHVSPRNSGTPQMPSISIDEKELSINMQRGGYGAELGPNKPVSPPQCPLPSTHMQDIGYGMNMPSHLSNHNPDQTNLSMPQYCGVQPSHSMLHSPFSLQSRMRTTPTVDPSRCITPSSQHLTNDSLSRILSTPPTPLTQTSLAYPTPSPSPGFHVQGRMGYQSYQNLTNYPNYQNYALQNPTPYAPRPSHPYPQNPQVYNPYGSYY